MLINKELAKADIIIPRDTSWIMIKHLVSLGLKVVVAIEDFGIYHRTRRIAILYQLGVMSESLQRSKICPLTTTEIKTFYRDVIQTLQDLHDGYPIISLVRNQYPWFGVDYNIIRYLINDL